MVAAKKKKIVVPKTFGGCADKLFELKAKRAEVKTQLDDIDEDIKAIKEHIIQKMPKTDTGASGKKARIKIVTKEIPQVKDWEAFYKYVKRTNSFDLLQRRLSVAAVAERLDDKKKLPGVEIFDAVTISLNKI